MSIFIPNIIRPLEPRSQNRVGCPYYCSTCDRSFSATKNTPLAYVQTPISVMVHVLSARTEGMGINAAARLYGVSKNSIYRWQERLSGVKQTLLLYALTHQCLSQVI